MNRNERAKLTSHCRINLYRTGEQCGNYNARFILRIGSKEPQTPRDHDAEDRRGCLGRTLGGPLPDDLPAGCWTLPGIRHLGIGNSRSIRGRIRLLFLQAFPRVRSLPMNEPIRQKSAAASFIVVIAMVV